MSDESPLTTLLVHALQRLDETGEEGLEEFLQSHPQHAEALRLRLRHLQGVGLLGSGESDSPDRLGEYVLHERLGVGGMGVVYRAEQPLLKRQVALKLIRPEHLFFPESRQRFHREVQAIAQLEHPGIVRVYEAGEEQGLPYFTMELVPGVPLSTVLERLRGTRQSRLDDAALHEVLKSLRGDDPRGPALFEPAGRSWSEVCFRWARSLADALAYSHAAGVLHRDLKPSNVMLTWDCRVLLLDFGLASTEGGSRITRSGAAVGSLAYMAPEQLRGDATAVNERTDVYGLGVTLYEMLALRHPFQDEEADSTRTIQRILEGRVPALGTSQRPIPWDAETVCMAAIDRDPARRYQSAEAFSRDLDNVLHFRPIAARRPGPWLRLRRFTQRHPAVSVGIVLGLTLALALPLGLWRAQVARTRAVSAEQTRTRAALETVQEQRDEIQRQRDGILAQSQLAQERFETAVRIVADVSLQVGFVELRNVPGAAPVRHQLLEIASQSANALLAEIPDHRLAREVAARIDHHRGQVFLEEDQHARARPLLEDAEEVFRELWEEDPEDLEVALQYALTENLLATSYHEREDLDRARDYYYVAIDICEQSLERARTADLRDDLRRHYSECLLNLGTMLLHVPGSREEGRELLGEARALIEESVDENPSVKNRTQLMLVLNNLALAVESPEQALALYRESLEMARSVVRSSPGDRNLLYYESTALSNTANLRLLVEQTPEACAEVEQLLEESLARSRSLCRDHPERSDYRLKVATDLTLYLELDGYRETPPAERRQRCEECLALLDPLCEEGYPRAHNDRGVVRNYLVSALLDLDRGEEARAVLEEAVRDLEAVKGRFPTWDARLDQVLDALRETSDRVARGDRAPDTP